MIFITNSVQKSGLDIFTNGWVRCIWKLFLFENNHITREKRMGYSNFKLQRVWPLLRHYPKGESLVFPVVMHANRKAVPDRIKAGPLCRPAKMNTFFQPAICFQNVFGRRVTCSFHGFLSTYRVPSRGL